jgi:DNA invertase Pin-like site-specific DNA recombinase
VAVSGKKVGDTSSRFNRRRAVDDSIIRNLYAIGTTAQKVAEQTGLSLHTIKKHYELLSAEGVKRAKP